MKPRPILRVVLAMVIAAGSFVMLKAAKLLPGGEKTAKNTLCNVPSSEVLERSNNEFIFFESVTKYLMLPLVK